MTSEVALLNKSCIAVAADSATTVTYWDQGKEKTRYFKGANKIFNLSSESPVGLMTYASASLQGVPWEILVKAYRQRLKGKRHEQLCQYATDFFDFVTESSDIFPAAIQEQQFKKLADSSAERIVRPILEDQAFMAATDDAERAAIFDAQFPAHEASVTNSQLIPGATQADVDSAVRRFEVEVEAMLESDKWYDRIPRTAMQRLAKTAIAGVYRSEFSALQSTGLAFAGYGEKEYFPKMYVYRCHGMVLGKVLRVEEQKFEISQENASALVPFAMSEMISTFIWGVGDTALEEITGMFHSQVEELIKSLKAAGHIAGAADLSASAASARKSFIKELIGSLLKSHRVPIQRVIASLPFSEMAELAEALVFMESMKERVTMPTESVSGPIDVAVISKDDGFIWIKRKHYFDPKLNPRFFARHSSH